MIPGYNHASLHSIILIQDAITKEPTFGNQVLGAKSTNRDCVPLSPPEADVPARPSASLHTTKLQLDTATTFSSPLHPSRHSYVDTDPSLNKYRWAISAVSNPKTTSTAKGAHSALRLRPQPEHLYRAMSLPRSQKLEDRREH